MYIAPSRRKAIENVRYTSEPEAGLWLWFTVYTVLPLKRTWNPKITPLKGKWSSKPPILGFRLVFGSVTGMERTLEDLMGAHFWSSKRRAREEARLFQQRFLLGLSVVLNMLNL